ncbi:MAG: DNA polymerase III subunit delta [Lachnospiraceae bacterium]|nr:DNA polymerase III subunit delta [Lachnospiraceae bacterium]
MAERKSVKNKINGMDIISAHIDSGEFSKVYLLHGTETYLMRQYRDMLVDALIDREDSMNYTNLKAENANPEEITSFIQTMPFFGDRRVALVEYSGFFEKAGKELLEMVEDIPDTSVLIFMETAVKKEPLYKKVAEIGTIAEFSTPNEATLTNWIARKITAEGLQVETAAVRLLLESVALDMNNLSNEVEKLIFYCKEKGTVTTHDVEKMCVSQVEGKIFEMIDALSRKDGRTVISLYEDLVYLKEPYRRMLANITTNFRRTMKVRLCMDEGKNFGEIMNILEIKEYPTKKYMALAKKYDYSRLKSYVERCGLADTQIKTYVMHEKMAMDMLLADLLKE